LGEKKSGEEVFTWIIFRRSSPLLKILVRTELWIKFSLSFVAMVLLPLAGSPTMTIYSLAPASALGGTLCPFAEVTTGCSVYSIQ
jgi:hypothetical protein